MNQVSIVGRATKELELRKTQTGKSVLSFTVAVKRTYNRDETDFINCVAWEKTADILAQYGFKGCLLSLSGRIQPSTYDDKDGKKVYKQDIVVENVDILDRKEEKQASTYKPDYKVEDEPQSNPSSPAIDEDELPF